MSIHDLSTYRKTRPLARLNALRPFLVMTSEKDKYWSDGTGVLQMSDAGREEIAEMFQLMHAVMPDSLDIYQLCAIQDYFSNLAFNIRMLLVREDLFLEQHTLETPDEYAFARAFCLSDEARCQALMRNLLEAFLEKTLRSRLLGAPSKICKRPTIPHLRLVT